MSSEVPVDLKREALAEESERDVKRVKIEDQEVKIDKDNITTNSRSYIASGITEKDVGITQTIFQGGERVIGNLKVRYTDFLVNEITLDDEVVHLVDEGFPMRKQRRQEERETKQQEEGSDNDKQEEGKSENAEKPAGFELADNHRTALVELLGEDIVVKMLELIEKGSGIVETERSYDDKEKRTKIHRLCREAFKGKIETITTETNTFQMGINSRAGGNFNNRRNNNSGKTTASKSEIIHNLGAQKKYVHFTLYKENKETMEVAGLLAKLLKLPVKFIKYAGTKDRRGVTVQKLSVEKLTVERLNNLNKILRGVRIGGFEYHDDSLRLGDLKGNEFIITIKDVKTLSGSSNDKDVITSTIEPIMESLKTRGFVNYYGMQRFGTFTISTHEIGKQILQNNWYKAVDLILGEQEVVVPDSVDARKIWAETKDPSKAIKKMPRRCSAEYSVLSRLEKLPKESNNDYSENSCFNAIMGIPRNLRIMYGHAYQSYVWNIVASARLELFGLEPVVGDLVLSEDGDKKSESNDGKSSNEEAAEEDDEEFIEDIKRDQFIRARPITQEEIEAQKFSIYDIVLPTPGFDVNYPSNEEIRKVYVDVMAKDNLDPFNMSRRVKEFSLAGSYRHVFAKPAKLEWRVMKYKNDTDSLVKTDLQLLRLKQAKLKKATDNNNDFDGESKIDKSIDESNRYVEEEVTDGEKTAIILKMQLGVSTYATMALRELIAGENKP